MSGKVSKMDPDALMMSSGKKSASDALENLDINLDEMSQPLGIEQQHSDLRISGIKVDDQPSGRKDGADDLAEMEKLLKSSGAFGGKQDLSNTFKKIRNELEEDEDYEDDGSKM